MINTIRINLVKFLMLAAHLSFAQGNDSILSFLKSDTLIYKSLAKADSIALDFPSKADSLNALYQRQFIQLQSASNRIQVMIDSLQQLKLPIEKLTAKMDSLQRVMDNQIHSLTEQTAHLKSKFTQHFSEIQPPPPLQEHLQKLQSSVNNHALPSLTSLSGTLAGVEIPDLGNGQVPALGNQLNLNSNIGINGLTGNIMDLAGEAGTYGQDIQRLLSNDIGDLKNIDQVMEGKLLDMEGAEQLKEGTTLFNQAEKFDSTALADKANAMVKEVVAKTAKNHFEGKQEILQKAMSDMARLKNKYEEVQSVAALPRRLPNPLRGKPFLERIIPAVTFQVLKSDYLLLDINPMLMYRIRPGIAMGLGWNQRLPWDGWSMIEQETVFGPRAALEVGWKRGISFRLLPELMNTTIPKMVAQAKGVDATYREWVGGCFAGIKKDYTVYKNIKGNTEILFNLFDPDGLSPYGDRLSLRFGFDFPMKKGWRD